MMQQDKALADGANQFARKQRRRALAELTRLLRFPSVSAQPRHAADLRRCALWLARHLRRIGLEQVRILRTPRHPIVLAEWRHAPGRPTVLIYGHYDVQPPEPLEEWGSPPFEPTVRGRDLHARGASDDKGQIFAHVKALEAYLCTAGRLPVNVRCVFEGEEEVGSASLRRLVRSHPGAFAADVAVVSDTRIPGPDQPALTYALRGGLSLEIEVRGPPRDLHSGSFGGAILNPLQALCEMIASLHDGDGRVAIPGFYDRVRRWSPLERQRMARSGPADAQILRDAGVEQGWGERGYSLYERTTVRPALTVNGMSGGYDGPGSKSVIPARASAKLNLRLVPDQEPREIARLLRRHVSRHCSGALRCAVRVSSMAWPVYLDRRHPALEAAALAYRDSFGTPPVFLRSGGTIPIVGTLQRELRIPVVLMGFALPDDGMHAPNEKLHLPTFFRAIETCIGFLARIPAVLSRGVGRDGRPAESGIALRGRPPLPPVRPRPTPPAWAVGQPGERRERPEPCQAASLESDASGPQA
jgi:acetylornithine deacetylase/succinyl-diaminopimelate desuccinylase-like protein